MATLGPVRIAPATNEYIRDEEEKDPLLKKVVTGLIWRLEREADLSAIVSPDTIHLRFSSNFPIGSLSRAFSEWSTKIMEMSISLSWLKSKN